jgi:hypothetical protein
MTASSRSYLRPILGGLGVTALLCALFSVDPTAGPVDNAVYSEAQVVLDRLNQAAEPVGRIPMEWAAPTLARAGLSVWVRGLPLKPEVRDRVLASIEAQNLVDELIPFLLFLKDTYARTTLKDSEDANFALWARASLQPGPGLEHDNFQFVPPTEPETTSKKAAFLTPDRIARLVELYDAAWLSSPRPGQDVGERLVCTADGPNIPDSVLAVRVEATLPVLKTLFEEAATQLPEGDMRAAAVAITKDEARQRAISATLLQFVDGEVCKHYRVFARRLTTTRAVQAMLDAGIEHPEQHEMWTWLHYQDTRHLGVQIVVDGLQGRLVRALANPTGLDPYLRWAMENRAPSKPTPSAVPTPPIHEAYLRDFVTRGGHPLPFFERLLGTVQPGIALQGVSTTPTISVRNLPIVQTGAPVAGPGGTGIPNFHFVDRSARGSEAAQGRAYYFYGNDALLLPTLARQQGMKTLFQRLESLNTMSCGAQYDERAGFSFDAFLNLAIGESMRDFGESLCMAELNQRALNERALRDLRAALLEREAVLAASHHPWELWDLWNQRNVRVHAHALAQQIAELAPDAMPDLLQWYDPWPDHYAHGKGPLSDEIVSPTGELARLSFWLDKADAAYEAAGVKPRTLFGMAGDHGLSAVHWYVRPEVEVLEGLANDGVTLKVTKISSDEGEGPKLTDPLRPPSMRGWDVVVASTAGGNYMMDWFVDQGDNWGRQPVLSELRALKVQSGQTLDVIDQTVRRLGDSLDYLAVREGPCDAEQAHVYLEGERSGERVVVHLTRVGDRIRYQQGAPGTADLLDLRGRSPWGAMPQSAEPCVAASLSEDPAAWCDETTWRAKTWASVRPDSVVQLAHLYDTDLAGTVNLFPKDGVGYNTLVPGRHAGESYAEKDAFVGVWGAPVDPSAPQVSVAVNGAMPMAIWAWITGQNPVQGEDGWGYDPVLNVPASAASVTGS